MPSTLPLDHRGSPQYWIFRSERRRNMVCLWSLNTRAGDESAISDCMSVCRRGACSQVVDLYFLRTKQMHSAFYHYVPWNNDRNGQQIKNEWINVSTGQNYLSVGVKHRPLNLWGRKLLLGRRGTCIVVLCVSCIVTWGGCKKGIPNRTES